MGKESQNLSKYESAKAFLSILNSKNGISAQVLEPLNKIIEEKTVLTSEQKSVLRDFFEKTDDTIAKTEGWRNLYHVYLENQISDKSRQVDGWISEKKELGNRMKTLQSNADLSKLDVELRIAEREESYVMYEVQQAKEAYEEKQKEHLAKGWKLHKKLNFSTSYLRQMIEEHAEKVYAIPGIINMLESDADIFDAQTEELLNVRKGLREYNKANASIKSDNKTRENLITDAIKKGKTIPELKEHAQNVEQQFNCEKALTKFMDAMKSISDEECGPFRSDKTTEAFHKAGGEALKTIGENASDWKKLSINQFESLLRGYLDKATERASVSKKEAQTHEMYEDVFKTEKLKEVEAKIEKYHELKKRYPDYTIEEEKDAVKVANQVRNQYIQDNMDYFKKAGVANRIRTIPDNKAVTADETEVYKTQHIIDVLNEEFNELENKFLSLESEYKIRLLESKYTQLRSDAQKDEKVIKANELRAQKAELGNIKQETNTLKEKINPEIITGSIKEKAEMFLEQKAFRKGSHSDSKEYKAMISALTIVKEWGNPDSPIAAEMNSPKAPKSLSEALELLQKTSDNYLKAKASQIRLSPSALRQSRLSFAESVKSFATTGLQTCNQLIPKEKTPGLNAEKTGLDVQNKEIKPQEWNISI